MIEPSAMRVAIALEATFETVMTPLTSTLANAVAEAIVVAPEG